MTLKFSLKTMAAGFCLLLFMLPRVNAQSKDGWRQLFNGKDFTGWKQVGKGSRYIKDGLTGSKGGMGLLYYTKQKFSNCHHPHSL